MEQTIEFSTQGKITPKLIRRGLSGIYIFDKFPEDDRQKPTCVEDCRPETRHEWCMKKNSEYLYDVLKLLSTTYDGMLNFLVDENVITMEEYSALIDGIGKPEDGLGVETLSFRIDAMSVKITTIADLFGVGTKPIEEDE